jgi:clan AA aspartic protease (TIGR02281 family)
MHKLKYFLILSFSTCIISCYSQEVKSKDGVLLGKRNELIDGCAKSANNELVKINGMEMNPYKYCECLFDNVIPNVNSWDLEKAVNENKIIDLLLIDTNLEIIKNCLEGNYKIKDDYQFGNFKNIEPLMKLEIKSCVNEIMNNKELNDLWTKEIAEKYCNCAIGKLQSSNYKYKDLLQIENENSTTFNEIVIPCLAEIIKTKSDFNSSNAYNINDIIGNSYRTLIPLTDYFGKGYKIKITIAGLSNYYLFDTGASDLIIDRNIERELLLNGVLKRENYLNLSEYSLANNQIIKAQKVKIDNITIGDYTINNVVIAIIDEGSLLCGKSFLDKFKKWEIDKQNNLLILYK